MKQFISIGRPFVLQPEQLAELCELFVTGEMNVFQLARKFDINVDTVNRYLYTHYYGIIPKHKQITITIKDKE